MPSDVVRYYQLLEQERQEGWIEADKVTRRLIAENPSGLDPGILRSKLKEIPGMKGENDARVIEKMWSLIGAGVVEISTECKLVKGKNFA